MSVTTQPTTETINNCESQLNAVAVNTSQCFLCLRQINFNSNLSYETELKSIQCILQYLNLSQKSLISRESTNYYVRDKDATKYKHRTEKCDSFVKLCSSCSPSIAKLSSLIRQMEVTKMWIDNKIQEVHQVLHASENQELFMKSPESQELHLLRSRLKSKCDSAAQAGRASGPKVILERLELLPPAVSVKIEAQDDSDSDQDSWSTDNISGQDDLEMDPLSENEQSDEDEVTPSSKQISIDNLIKLLAKPVSSYMLTKQVSTNGARQCLICHKNVRPPKEASFHFHVVHHIATYHVQEFFMKLKCKDLADDQFAKYCQQVIFLEFNEARSLSASKRFNCPYCTFTCAKNLTQSFRSHLIRFHYNTLEQKISELQNQLTSKGLEEVERYLTTNLPDNHSERNCRKCENWVQFAQVSEKLRKQGRCALCQQTCTQKSFKMHLIQFHPETLFNANSTWNTTDKQQFHKLCKYVLNSEANLAERVKVGRDGDNRYDYICHICSNKVEGFNRNLHHLAFRHFKILKEKLKLLEQDKNLDFSSLALAPKPYAGKSLATSSKALINFCNQFCEKLAAVSKVRCTLCNESFGTKRKRHHFTRRHMEVVFGNMKLESVSQEQFGICCNQLIKSEIAQAKHNSVSGTRLYKCPYCRENVSRNHTTTIQDHAIFDHFEVMGEHLVRLQTEKIWENEGFSDEDCHESDAKRKHADLYKGLDVGDNIKRIKVEEINVDSEGDEQFEEIPLPTGRGSGIASNYVIEADHDIKHEVFCND